MLRTVLRLLVIALVGPFAPAASHAGTHPSTPRSVPITWPPRNGSGFTVAAATCSLGVTGPGVQAEDYIVPPDDIYSTVIVPNACSACGAGAFPKVTAAHVVLLFENAPCSIPVTVSLVGTNGTSCRTPNFAKVLCPPVQATFSASSLGLVDFAVPLPDTVRLRGPAFLKVDFVSDANCPTMPLFAVDASCQTCQSYNTIGASNTDLCGSPAFPGNPIMYLETQCPNTGVADAPGRVLALRATPNPARPRAAIEFSLARPGPTRVAVYDVSGARVRTLADGMLGAGTQRLTWDGRTDAGMLAPAGAYWCEVLSGDTSARGRFVLLR